MDEERTYCSTCDCDTTEQPAQVTLDGSLVCLPCANDVMRLLKATKPEARDDGR